MTPKIKCFRNGWTSSMDKSGSLYVVLVRNASGDVHDKTLCDDYRMAIEYYRAFTAIAKAA